MKRWGKAETFDAFFEANTDVTQLDVATALGITQGHLSQIRHGQRMPRPELALRIHRLIGIPPETLLRARVEGAA